jgi:hypothetical protein
VPPVNVMFEAPKGLSLEFAKARFQLMERLNVNYSPRSVTDWIENKGSSLDYVRNERLNSSPSRSVIACWGLALSAEELVNHDRREHILSHWFGPFNGSHFSIICIDRKEIIITYLPKGVSANHPDQFDPTVETGSSALASDQTGRSDKVTDKDVFIASNGRYH